jgi:cell division protease FtsH
VADGFATARRILTEKNEDLERLAKGLLEYETLTGEEITNLIKGIPPKRDDASKPPSGRSSSSVPTTGTAKPGGAGMEPQPQA